MKLRIKDYAVRFIAIVACGYLIMQLASLFGASTRLSMSLGVVFGVSIGTWFIARYRHIQGQILDQDEFLANKSERDEISSTQHL